MLVSCATGGVACQALPGIELKTEFAQARQRQARNFHHSHLCRSIPRHPDRQLRQRPVRLADDHGDFIAMPIASLNNDRLATTRMKAVADCDFTRLVVGIMPPLRRHPVWSSAG